MSTELWIAGIIALAVVLVVLVLALTGGLKKLVARPQDGEFEAEGYAPPKSNFKALRSSFRGTKVRTGPDAKTKFNRTTAVDSEFDIGTSGPTTPPPPDEADGPAEGSNG